MRDSRPIEAERALQLWFRKAAPLTILLPPVCVLLFAWFLYNTPNRDELGPRTALVRYEPLQLDSERFAPLRLAGAWVLSSEDPRFGGISGLAKEPGGLLALTDSGILISLPKPESKRAPAFIRELPDGPGDRRFKRHRDTEALLADPLRRGWWVAYERHNQLWLYDERFSSALEKLAFSSTRWAHNTGIEAIAAAGGALILVPEDGSTLLEVRGAQARRFALPEQTGRIADAAALPDGSLLLLERQPTLRGFANSLVTIEKAGGHYRERRRIRLPLGPLDNAEALALEPLSGGAMRLWIMTDDNDQQPFRTVLLSLEMPAGGANAAERQAD